jgi:hypothetical protein
MSHSRPPPRLTDPLPAVGGGPDDCALPAPAEQRLPSPTAQSSSPRPAPSSVLTVEDAARVLSTTPTALRARCRRHARRAGRDVIARLGGGVVAFKFGASWRLRIDPP